MGVKKGWRGWDCELLLTAKKLYEASWSVSPKELQQASEKKQVEPLILAWEVTG